MAVINTNVKALFSQAALKSTERSQTIAMQQLSTGKRINSARDDAAGMAISTRMTHQIRSLNQAVRNAGDAISLIQTAEGATNEITDMMQRMRELAIQAVNDTNENAQRSYLDLEFQQLKQQIVQIAEATEWNGFPVLSGSAGERVGEMPLFKVTSENQFGTVFIDPTTSRTVGGSDAGERQTITLSSTNTTFASGTIKVGGVDVVIDATVQNTTDLIAAKIQQTLSNNSAFNSSSGRSVSVVGSVITVTYAAGEGDVSAISTDFSAITAASGLAMAVASTRDALASGVEQFKDNGAFLKSGALSMNVNTSGAVTASFLTEKGETINMSGVFNNTAVNETSAVTFNAMTAGQTITLGGLTYTAGSTGATAAEVATDFASRANGYAGTGGTGPAKGTFSGTLSGFASGAVSTSTTVTFTSATTGTNVTNLSVTGSGALPTVVVTNGAPASSVTFIKTSGSNAQVISDDMVYEFKKSDGTAVSLNGRAFEYHVDVAGSIPSLRAGDLKINGIDIGASYATDDSVSPANNAAGSAIAKAAAINRKAVSTGVTRGETQSLTFSGTPSPGTVMVAGVSVSLDAMDTTSASATAKIAAALQASPLFGEPTGRMVTYIPGNSSLTITYAAAEGNVAPTNVQMGSTNLVGLVDTIGEYFVANEGTGVFAKVNENMMSGAAMSGTSVLNGVVFVNGFASANITTVLNNPRETRMAVAKAINLISDKTGVKAIDTGSDTKGITLLAADGRNIEVSFETSANAEDFGARIGMRQGVQSSTISLQSKIPTPVVLTSDSTGDITRAGLVQGNFTRNQAVANTVVRPIVNPAVAQVDSVTFTTNPTAGDIYYVTVNGTTFEYTAVTGATNLTPQKVRDELITKINANTDLTVTAKAGRNIGEILLESDTPGTSFTLSVSKSSGATSTVSTVNVVENAKADFKPLGKDDLMINGVKIRPTTSADDEFSDSPATSNDRSASAIAIANAINAQTPITAVRAQAKGPEIKGSVTQTSLPVLATPTLQSLYLNGVEVQVEFVQNETGTARRTKVVEAINQRSGQHGVTATDNGNGVSLVSDGRNTSVWFNSNVKDLSAANFGLDQGGAVKQVSRINIAGTVAVTDSASVVINGVTITSANASATTAASLATALETAINAAITAGTIKNVSVSRTAGVLDITSSVAGSPFELLGAKVINSSVATAATMALDTVTANDFGNTQITGIRDATATSTTARTLYGTVSMIAQAPQMPGLPVPIGAPPSELEKLLRANGKPFVVSAGDDGFGVNSNFSVLGFQEGTFGGRSSSDMDPPKVGRLAFQVGASSNQLITIDLADFGKGGPITGEITGDVDLNVESRSVRINTREGASAVLSKLDAAMDQVNATRATMGAVMNRLEHVISNLSNVSMNMSASRSQIEDADYASASTELAKNQIMQQAGTAVLAQANTSQQSVLKLLGG
ncbi:FlgL Flagellin and related hook-associated proteins [Burkholderiaceae bacterium]